MDIPSGGVGKDRRASSERGAAMRFVKITGAYRLPVAA